MPVRLDHAAPLKPRGRRVWIVRWVRADGRETVHKIYMRRHPAERFCRRLKRSGREAEIFTSAVDWSAGARS